MVDSLKSIISKASAFLWQTFSRWMVISTSQAMLHVNMTPDTQWYNLTCVCVFMRPIDDYRSTRRRTSEDRHSRVYSRLNVTAVAVLVFSVLGALIMMLV